MVSRSHSPGAAVLDCGSLMQRYREVRAASLAMCAPLEAEDYRAQPIAEVSPPWWNLGHTSWFFVRNLLQQFGGHMTPEDQQLDQALNSYYVSLGPRVERSRRGLLTRPTTDEIYRYRSSVDERVERLVASGKSSSAVAINCSTACRARVSCGSWSWDREMGPSWSRFCVVAWTEVCASNAC